MYLIELNYTWVPHNPQDVQLPCNPFDVMHICNFVLDDDFDCD